MNYSQYFLRNSMDMVSLFRIIFGTILNYKMDPYVHCSGSLNRANDDNSSWKFLKLLSSSGAQAHDFGIVISNLGLDLSSALIPYHACNPACTMLVLSAELTIAETKEEVADDGTAMDL